jgi:hypothetical protein
LPPDQVPRDGEKIGEDDEDEGFTYKRREKERPSGVLKDILVGLSLRSAKERFEGREWAEEDKVVEGDGGDDGLVEAPGSGSDDEDGELNKEATREEVHWRPVVSADDERSREILLPTVRHTLSRLDDLLMALHHARKTCRRYSSVSAPDSDDEFHPAEEEQDEDEDEDIPMKPVGRPKKFENLTHRGKPDEIEEEDRTFMPTDHLRIKKPGRGRKPKQYPRLEGENDREYLVRVARLQKKPIPLFTGETASPSPVRKSPQKAAPSPVRKSPKKSATPRKNSAPPEEMAKKRQRGLGLRDWSEVLGSAALVGFPPDVIARATQRCANIFGESMNMRTMIEAPFDADSADTLTTYEPEEIPDFDSEENTSDDEQSDGDSDATIPKHTQAKSSGCAPKIEVCFCPISNCPRQTRGFASTQKMKEHLKNGHTMSQEEIKEFEIPSDEEMDGAVHVDGFLRSEKRASRGPDKNQRKRRRKADGDVDTDVEKVEESESEVEPEESGESEERGWTTSEEEDGPGEQSEEDEIKVEKTESSDSEGS